MCGYKQKQLEVGLFVLEDLFPSLQAHPGKAYLVCSLPMTSANDYNKGNRQGPHLEENI